MTIISNPHLNQGRLISVVLDCQFLFFVNMFCWFSGIQIQQEYSSCTHHFNFIPEIQGCIVLQVHWDIEVALPFPFQPIHPPTHPATKSPPLPPTHSPHHCHSLIQFPLGPLIAINWAQSLTDHPGSMLLSRNHHVTIQCATVCNLQSAKNLN